MHSYTKYVNPYLGKRLSEIGMDKRFVRGDGCYLYDDQGHKYLDFIAAYGALPFGYNHPRIWDAVQQLHSNMHPSFAQPSHLEAAGQLAAALVAAAPPGIQYATFANSGAEAVEAAIKLCRARTGRRSIVTATNSFHGKTLGALSATGNRGYQDAFFAPVEGFRHIPFGDLDALKTILEEDAVGTAAIMLEPIQGEGGIVEPPSGYLTEVRRLCTEYEVPLILDEIQTGLGRTGSLFACEREQVVPDVLVLAKALSGGLVPIGVTLCTEDMYTEAFGMKHSSTFGGNALAATVGLEVMQMLTEDNGAILRHVDEQGQVLKRGLLDIQNRYPEVVRGVRGRGFMLGIDFGTDKNVYPHSLLGVLAEQEILTPIVSSYMLNTERLRVAPTLNGASVIRVEPPLTAGPAEIQRALEAIEATASVLSAKNTAGLLGHLVNWEPPGELESFAYQRGGEEAKPAPGMSRFAFLIHPVDLSNYTEFDRSMEVFDEAQLRDLSLRWNDMVEPFVVSSTVVTGQDGSQAYGEFICVPRTAQQLLDMSKEQAEQEILQAVELAASRGAQLVGLGAYTSVVTTGGRSLLGKAPIPVTTGNSYTVLSGLEALMYGAERLGVDLQQTTAAILGAGGAIGKASASLLGEEVQRLILVGNPARAEKSQHRMLKVVAEFMRRSVQRCQAGYRFAPGSVAATVVRWSQGLDPESSLGPWLEAAKQFVSESEQILLTVDAERYLPEADLILSATSSTEALIQPHMLKWGALVCDMSRPVNVSRDVLQRREDVLVIDGGVIEVPGRPDLGWDFGFDKGLAYACMSETMMLALAGRFENASIGADLNLDHLQLLRDLAVTFGFRLAGFRSFDKPIAEGVWERVVAARRKELVAEAAHGG